MSRRSAPVRTTEPSTVGTGTASRGPSRSSRTGASRGASRGRGTSAQNGTSISTLVASEGIDDTPSSGRSRGSRGRGLQKLISSQGVSVANSSDKTVITIDHEKPVFKKPPRVGVNPSGQKLRNAVQQKWSGLPLYSPLWRAWQQRENYARRYYR